MALLDILKKKKSTRGTNAEHTRNKRGLDADTMRNERGANAEQAQIKHTTEAKQAPKKHAAETNTLRGKQDTTKGELFSHIIIRPRITEKASTGGGKNAYTFEVLKSANKIQIKKAVQEVYGVEPTRVNIINVKPKQKMVRNMLGKTASFKKAIVFLKEGDTIEFV